jgi:hypothetical protein
MQTVPSIEHDLSLQPHLPPHQSPTLFRLLNLPPMLPPTTNSERMPTRNTTTTTLPKIPPSVSITRAIPRRAPAAATMRPSRRPTVTGALRSRRRRRARDRSRRRRRRLRHSAHCAAATSTTNSADDQIRNQRQVPARIAYIYLVRASLQQPLLRSDIPCTQVLAGERKGDGSRSAGSEEDLLEAAQLFDGAVGDADVELCDFCGGDGAGVGDGRGNCEECAEEVRVAAGKDCGRGGVGR